jgi:DNA invertase Pin-like site-specific DNA recombinase
MRLTSRKKRSAIVVVLFHDFTFDNLPLILSTNARIFSVVSNTVLAAVAEHERQMIGERTRHALAAKNRGINQP